MPVHSFSGSVGQAEAAWHEQLPGVEFTLSFTEKGLHGGNMDRESRTFPKCMCA